jgi:cytochrome c peroxidase
MTKLTTFLNSSIHLTLIIMKQVIYILICFFLVSSCSEEEVYIPVPTPVDLEVPSNFPEVEYNFENNILTEEGITLGKKLFYEGKLAKDDIISCGFCHEQASGFTHHGHTISHGVDGNEGFRNTQPIQNLAFFSEFTWDGAAIHLDLQPIVPITSEFEMGETLPSVVQKITAESEYSGLFRNAFGDEEVTSERILKALSQFMISMISANSKYDKVIRNEENTSFSEKESKGFQVFKNKCASCHSGELFTDKTYRNNGIPVNPKYVEDEEGRKRVTGADEDFYKFRVPSLRNVAVTFPYMHDGRFRTLESVLDFYTDGMTENGGIVDPLLIKADGNLGIDLTELEKEQIIAFLQTLTDYEFLNDKRFAEF